MKLTLIYCLLPFCLYAQKEDINLYRDLFLKSPFKAEACDSLFFLTESKNDPILLGYNGVATIFKAEHTHSIFLKWNYFKKGKKLLESAIGMDTTSLELRLLRYSIQLNTPSFLNYTKNIKEDENFLKKHLALLPEYYYNYYEELKKIKNK